MAERRSPPAGEAHTSRPLSPGWTDQQFRAMVTTSSSVLYRKEVHHRAKNSLQVVDSLLRLMEDAFPDPRLRQVVADTANRGERPESFEA